MFPYVYPSAGMLQRKRQIVPTAVARDQAMITGEGFSDTGIPEAAINAGPSVRPTADQASLRQPMIDQADIAQADFDTMSGTPLQSVGMTESRFKSVPEMQVPVAGNEDEWEGGDPESEQQPAQQSSMQRGLLRSDALDALRAHDQAIPGQDKPKLWQKLLAAGLGGVGVVAAMNAKRVQPNPYLFAQGVRGILYPNEGQRRQEWQDKRAVLRDAADMEQSLNSNVLRQQQLDQQAEINKSRAASEAKLRDAQAYDMLSRGALNLEKVSQLRNSKDKNEQKLADDLEQYLLWTAQRQIQSKDPEQVQQGQKTIEELKKQKAEAEARKNQTRPDNSATAMQMEATVAQIMAEDKQNNITRTPEEVQREARVRIGREIQKLNEAELERKKRVANRPVGGSGAVTGNAPNDPKDIAQAIIRGEQPPTMTGLYRNAGPVRAELARNGYDLTTAQRDWKAVERHLSTLNGPQQERLRQAVSFTYDSLDVLEDLYNQWKSTGLATRFKTLNKATLAAAKQLPGEPGALAHALEAQINDLTSELGTVYKGGNASTDESLRLAAENLKSNWNEETFKKQLGLIRKNLTIRKNSINQSVPIGVSPNSRYIPESQREVNDSTAESAQPGNQRVPKEGDTATGPDGKKIILRGGKWVPL